MSDEATRAARFSRRGLLKAGADLAATGVAPQRVSAAAPPTWDE